MIKFFYFFLPVAFGLLRTYQAVDILYDIVCA